VQAGLGQILLALVPLATLLLAVLWRQERVRGAAVIGTFFALVGVTLIASDPLRQVPPPLTSVLAVVGGSVCVAQALVIVRWFPRATRDDERCRHDNRSARPACRVDDRWRPVRASTAP
jgi:drug/metabolite transporter (DMT)-like permease